MGTDNDFRPFFSSLYDKQSAIDKERFQGIVQGSSGALLCLIQHYLFTHEEKFKEEIYALIDKTTSRPFSNPSLGYGIAGFAWVISLVEKFKLFESMDEWLNDIDKVLEQYYYLMLYKKDLDYFRGASGILFYFIERDRLSNIKVESFIDCLREREKGIPPSYYIDRDRNSINLGTPHGITGVILILLLIKEQKGGIVDFLIVELLEELLSYKKANKPYLFPRSVTDKDEEEAPSIIAWCYGDLMASYVILKAGLMLGRKKYIHFANQMLNELVKREDCQDNLILCHGYTSTSLVFNKMFELTNNEMLNNASIKWHKRSVNAFYIKFERYKKYQLFEDYFENASLFYGYSGFLLSFGGMFRKGCEKALLL